MAGPVQAGHAEAVVPAPRVQSGGKEESLGVKEASVTEEVMGPDYEALVAAMQRALVRFGQQMGDGIAAAKQLARAR